jgi:hypothetical protein
MHLTTLIFDNDATAAYDCMIPSQCMIMSGSPSRSARGCYPNEACSTRADEVLCQDCLWYFQRSFHGNVSPSGLRHAPRKLQSVPDMDTEFISTVWRPR